MTEIEKLEIRLQEFLRDFVVQRLVRVMAFFQKPADRNGDLFGVGFGLRPGAKSQRGADRNCDESAGRNGEVVSFLEKEV